MNTLQSMRILFTINTSEKITLISYSNTEMRTLGTCELQCVIANQNAILKFHVIDKPVKSIIGLPDALRLQLLHLHPRVHIKTKKIHNPAFGTNTDAENQHHPIHTIRSHYEVSLDSKNRKYAFLIALSTKRKNNITNSDDALASSHCMTLASRPKTHPVP